MLVYERGLTGIENIDIGGAQVKQQTFIMALETSDELNEDPFCGLVAFIGEQQGHGHHNANEKR
ncbi:5004_t:CDS:2 [Ambispora gerdemannii]|uniref:5004_t:CDS:1 n=1 Tax=Ambispora gerdemannii TaxID=144530 RepID=A0A9N8ZLK6_9GLOM|nr:5004_t:CDS:2 [Ambispora gerdemannii]